METVKSDWWKKGGYWGYGYSYDEEDDGSDLFNPNGSSYSSGTGYYTPRYKSSLGWKSGKLIDSAKGSWYGNWYSQSSVTKDEVTILSELLMKAYRTAREMVVILDFPTNIQLIFSNKDTVACNSTPIFVTTKMFDNIDKLSEDEKIEAVNQFCGQSIHEAAHLKYTEYRVLKDFINKIDHISTIDTEFTGDMSNFLLTLVEMIEDERIEDKLLKERPGYVDYIAIEKQWNYNNFIKNIKKTMVDSEEEEFISNLYRLIRFPDNIDEDIIQKYVYQYERIKNILTPMPESTREVCGKAVKVLKEVLKIFKELKFKHPNSVLSKLGSQAKKELNQCSGGFDENDVAKKIEGREYDNKVAEAIKGNDIITKLVTGVATKGEGKDTYLISEPGAENHYRDSKTRMSKFIPAIRKIIKGKDKNYDFNIYGCRSGLLDTNKLAEGYQGVPQIYIRKGTVRTNKTTVCVLVDESGSMGSSYYPGNLAYLAKDAAILLNEALSDIPGVDLYIYGHSADQTYRGSTELYVYREGNVVKDKYALSNINGRWENRDGTAIYEAAKRVRKLTDNHCIMLVLSDGDPAADNYYGYSAYRDVKKKVQDVEKLDFDVIQISIGYVGGVDEMFEKCISLDMDISNLPKRLGQVIKNLIIKDKKTTVS